MLQDYEQILDSQKEFFLSNKTLDIDFRIASLKKLQTVIEQNNDKIVDAIYRDFKKSEFETFATETMLVLEEIKLAIKHLKAWNKPLNVKSPFYLFKSKSKVYYNPYGTVLVIGAWNYPLQLTLLPLIGAVAAGNTCIVKPSELSPNTSGLIKLIIKDAFIPAHCAVIEGGVSETTDLLKLQFDFIHYTGSSRVGKIIAQSAAVHLTPIVLELGGKSPCIVDETADIEVSVRRILWGKFINAGQTCVAPDYLLVHDSIKDKFIDAAKKQLIEFYGSDVISNPDYCRIINKAHFERLTKLLKNENIIIGGKIDEDQLFIEPTIVDSSDWNSPLMQDEIFGPILPLFTYQKIEEVIDQINKKLHPLALYLFTKNKKIKRQVIENIRFGGGCINMTVMHIANIYLPFGGVGNSGMGCYHGVWSFETFSHKKAVFEKSFNFDLKLLYPPYKNKIKLLYKLFLQKKVNI